MGFLSQKVERSDLQAGDHIYSWRTPVYAYAHHGIYIGDNKVVHFTQDQSTSPNSSFTSFSSVPDCVETCFYIGDNKVVHFNQDQSISPNSSFTIFSSVPDAVETCLDFSDLRCGERRSGVIMSCLNCFLGKKGSLHRYEYGVGGVALVTKFRGGTCSTAKSDLPEEVNHKAMHLLQNGFGKYDVFTNNCEHFAVYCKTGLIVGPKGSGGSGQVHSIIGVPASAILSLPVWIFYANPVVLGAAAVGNYALSRYTADLGVRSDAVKIKVEELVALHRFFSSVDQEDAGLQGRVTKAEDLAMVSSDEDAWKLESVAEFKVNLLSADQEGAGLFRSVTKAEDLAGLLSAEEDAWKIERVAEVEVEDLAASHRNILSADQEGAGLFRSATKVKVEDLAASHHNILSADQEDAGLFGSATKVEDLAGLLSAEEDAWKLQSIAEVEVGDLAALHRNILSADQEDEGLLASIVSNRVERNELEAGDHIYTWRLPFTHAHHGIYKGEGKVIHSTQHKNPTSSSASKLTRFASLIPKAPTHCSDCEALGSRNHTNGVITSCLDCFLGEGSLHRFVYGVSKLDFVACSDAESDAAEVVIRRAMRFLEGGFGEYEVFGNNCEDFASYCKTGFLCNK